MKIIIYRRIDSTNVNLVEERINKELEYVSTDEVITIDASELEYVSSAGLRIILKIKKRFPNTNIINCNQEVYNIFEVTGFTEMMSISKTFKEISVDGCEVIGEGAYGKVYRIDPETIVKVYKNKDSLDVINRERNKARKAFVLGIPTAISYDIVKVDEYYGTVFEMLNAKSFAELLNEGESIDKLVDESVRILKQIHSTKNKLGDLPDKKEETLGWVKFDCDYLPKEIGDKLVKLIETIPNTNTVIHGDYHVKNLMHTNDDNLLIDMETLSVGYPILELACLYTIYEGFECFNKKNPEEFLGIPSDTCREFCELLIEKYFDSEDEKTIEEIKNKIKIICYARLLRRQLVHYGEDNEEAKKSIEYCKNYLIENVPMVDSLVF